MITRSQLGIFKPIDRLSLNTLSISPILKNPSGDLKDPQWSNAMYDEYNALVKNGTCILVPRPTCVNMVRSMWLFKHKFHANGTLSRYKAWLVANGSSQKLGDIILTASSTTLLQRLIRSLHSEFDMTDLGALNYFLGVSAVHHPTGLYLSQRQYASQLLERAHMANCNPSRTLVDTESKLVPEGVSVQDPTLYHSLAGGLQYLTFTEPHLSYVVPQGVAIVVAETAWIRNLLRELHSSLSSATLVYCDNVRAIYLSVNPVQHQWTKHIEINIHFVHNIVTAGQVRVLHVPSYYQFADIFTKGLPSALFEEF
ncbi:ribonuclease H-like domain-containing protein [Tanacetum coccineum]